MTRLTFTAGKQGQINWLQLVSVLYLLLPTLLFLLTWVRLPVGISCVLLLCSVGGYMFHQSKPQGVQDFPSWTWPNRLGTAGLSLVVLVYFGFGEFNRQTFDFLWHNLKYHDLIVNPWPVYYAKYNAYFCYYTAYYLPVAWLCKVFGVASGHYLALAWTWFGLTLVYWWVLVLSPKRPWWIILVLFLFSDSWIFVWLLRATGAVTAYIVPNYVDLGTYPLVLMSPFSDQIAWAPQHSIPALLVGLYLTFLYRQRQETWLPLVALLLGSALFWGPFAVIGAIPFVLYLFWLDRWRFIKQPVYIAYTLLIILGFVPLLSYLGGTQITTVAQVNNFIWQTGVRAWPLYYLLYIGTNFVIWYALLRWLSPTGSPMRHWLTVALVGLCVLPLYRIGLMNDWQMRGSIPAYCILILFAAQWLVNYAGRSQWLRWLFIAFWGVNALSTLKFFTLFTPVHAPQTTISQAGTGGSDTTPAITVKYYNPSSAGQFLLRPNSWFETYFMISRD